MANITNLSRRIANGGWVLGYWQREESREDKSGREDREREKERSAREITEDGKSRGQSRLRGQKGQVVERTASREQRGKRAESRGQRGESRRRSITVGA
jgi:hypothetical protein